MGNALRQRRFWRAGLGALLAVAGCELTVSLGGAPAPTTDLACKDKRCGDPCPLASPDGGTNEPGQCDDLGSCVLGPVPCKACETLPCGMPCSSGAAGAGGASTGAGGTFTGTGGVAPPPPGLPLCDGHGTCVVSGGLVCPPDPCFGLPCGAPCAPCAFGLDPTCSSLRYCDAFGQCTPTLPSCGPGGPCGEANGVPITCAAGSYCCNPSCGVCAPLGAACIDVSCEPGLEPCGPTLCGPGTYCCDPLCGVCATSGNTCPSVGCSQPGEVCGANYCAPGTVCCNPSCGICAPPGQPCVPDVCNPAPSCGNTDCPPGAFCCNPSCSICVESGGDCVQTSCP